jgi:hypothetical protein
VDAVTKRLDHLIGRASTHSNNYGPAHNRIWQVIKSGESDRAVRGQFFRLDYFAPGDAPAREGSPSVTGIKKATDVLIVFGLRSKDRIDLVIKNGRWSGLVSHLAKQVRGRRIDGENWSRHQYFSDFKGTGFATFRLR